MSTMFDKAVRVGLVVLILGLVIAAWSVGMNQFVSLLEKANITAERAALAECVQYGAPHALVVDGKAYCYMIYYGSEQILSLEKLRELYADPVQKSNN